MQTTNLQRLLRYLGQSIPDVSWRTQFEGVVDLLALTDVSFGFSDDLDARFVEASIMLDDATLWDEIARSNRIVPLRIDLLLFHAACAWLCAIVHDQDGEHERLLEAETTPPQLKTALQRVNRVLTMCRFDKQTAVIRRSWRPQNGNIVTLDCAVIFFVWAVTHFDRSIDPTIYENVNSCLSLASPFLLNVLAAACLKMDVVSRRVPNLQQNDEQFLVMQLLRTYADLPGLNW